MENRIKTVLKTALVAMLISSMAGCFYYRRVDDRDDERRPRYFDR
jgi:hypothetical protein